MPTLRDIKRRITAVKNTGQITKAMKMVAASKLRRAQTRMLEMRPYSEKMSAVIQSLSNTTEGTHPLLVKRPRKTTEIVVLTSDRGLCGAFNTNILKLSEKFIAEKKSGNFGVSISVVGKKASDYFRRRNIQMRSSWIGLSGRLAYSDAGKIADNVMEAFIGESIDEVFLVYNQFRTVIAQEVTVTRLLPLSEPEHEDRVAVAPVFIYEPSQQEILNQLLPKNIVVQIYRALLESQASEEAARMTAMENASKNASEMIEKLTLQYNKARQASITKELMDIVGGVEALKE